MSGLVTISEAADTAPYNGELPASAGMFAINSDIGVSATDPGDRHLIEVASHVLPEPLRQPGSAAVISRSGAARWIYTAVPPFETDPNVLATFSADSADERVPRLRATAGGLDILFWLQDKPDTLSEEEADDLRVVVAALNRTPFLGQPVDS